MRHWGPQLREEGGTPALAALGVTYEAARREAVDLLGPRNLPRMKARRRSTLPNAVPRSVDVSTQHVSF